MRLHEHYKTEVMPKLQETFGYTNTMAIPRLTRVTINVGVGRFTKDQVALDNVTQTLRAISGQAPVQTKSRKSIASFKVREGQVVGIMVTLRGARMYDFIEKLVHVTLPRVRDFRGLSTKSFDAQGNYTIGLKEHMAFPEVRAETIDKLHGLEICITTSARTKAEGEGLLRLLGFPFRNE